MFECVKAVDYSKTYYYNIWTIICSVVILLLNWIWYKLFLWKRIIKWNNIFYALTFFSDVDMKTQGFIMLHNQQSQI